MTRTGTCAHACTHAHTLTRTGYPSEAQNPYCASFAQESRNSELHALEQLRGCYACACVGVHDPSAVRMHGMRDARRRMGTSGSSCTSGSPGTCCRLLWRVWCPTLLPPATRTPGPWPAAWWASRPTGELLPGQHFPALQVSCFLVSR